MKNQTAIWEKVFIYQNSNQPQNKQIYVFQSPLRRRQVDGNGPSFREEFESKWRRRKGLFGPMASWKWGDMGAL